MADNAPTFGYLVEEAKTKKRRLIVAGAPANAIAFCAKSAFTAQRVEGAVFDTLKGTMELEYITPPKPEGDTGGEDNGEDKSGK